MSSIILNPFQLLEINVISAQDLAIVSRSMRSYAVVWVHPDRKLSTRVDTHGHNSPTWNDKFVFRVDDRFLYGDTSAIMIQIYAVSWFRDVPVGTVRVIVGNLIPPPPPSNHRHRHQPHIGMRFVALQVRRPSGRPQGILNIGIARLDSSMRSMPMYKHLHTSAVGFHDLMNGADEDDPNPYPNPNHHHHYHKLTHGLNDHQPHLKAQRLGRSRSERSERITDLEFNHNNPKSDIKKPPDDDSVEILPNRKKIKKKKYSSLVTESDAMNKIAMVKNPIDNHNPTPSIDPKPIENWMNALNLIKRNGSYLLDDEVGPSASEVCAGAEPSDGAVDKWSLDESVEGLRSKLERWRTELPPLYDKGELESLVANSSVVGGRGSERHMRRHTDEDDGRGLFSCFSNVCGYECSCVCGKNANDISAGIHGGKHLVITPSDGYMKPPGKVISSGHVNHQQKHVE